MITNMQARRGLWLLVFAFAGVLTGTAAGIIAYAGGAALTTAFLTGGGAVAGTVALLLAAAHFVVGHG